MAKGKAKKNNSALIKRIASLEQRQAADDKNTEYKVSYYNLTQVMDDSWGTNSGMAPRTIAGVDAETNMAGTSGAARIGNEINLRHWSLEAYVDLPKSVDGTPTYPLSQVPCRVILADNLTDDSALGISDILANPTSTAQSLISPYKNSANASKRYKIYADYKFTLTGEKDKRIKFKMPLPKSGRVLHFANSSATTPSDFNMTLFFYAQTSVTGSNHPNFNYVVKCRFTDS